MVGRNPTGRPRRSSAGKRRKEARKGMNLIQIVISIRTDEDPKAVIARANDSLPAEYQDMAFSVDGEWVDEEGDAL